MTAVALLSASKVDAVIERITPKIAERYIARNTHNRSVKAGVVRRLAAAMRRGEWLLNGESIKFDVAGNLVDGQHRLQAIIESGVTVAMLVVRGVEPQAQDTIDIGVKRTTGDVLHLHGYIDTNNLAGALTYYHRILTNQVRATGKEYLAPTPSELLEMVQEHPGIIESMAVANRLRRRIRAVKRSQFTALHYWLSHKDSDDAEWFFDHLETGEMLSSRHPVYALRRWLETTAAISKMARPTTVHGVTIKCWNAFRRNEEMGVARFRSGVEEWPEPV